MILDIHNYFVISKKSVASTTSLHDTPPLCLFCCSTCFGIKNTRFNQIHQLFHKILSINIILKSIKGHNSVEKFGKIICIRHNMDHISMHKQNFIKIHSLFLKIEISTPIKGQNSVEKFRKISCASHNTCTSYTNFHQNPSIWSQDIKWKQNSDINQGPLLQWKITKNNL